MNLATAVRANAATLGAKPAIRFHDNVITYASLWRDIEALAGNLEQLGIRAGQRVGLALKDHPPHVIAHYAVARLGAVILPLDHRWTMREKRATATAFKAAVVLTDGESIDGVNCAALDAALLAPAAGTLPPLSDRDDHDVLISLSSGTTGQPKGSLVTHRNLYARFEAQWQAIGYGEKDCFALLTPLFFGAGRAFAMATLAAGGTLRLAPPPRTPAQIVDVLRDPEVSATFLPPTLLRRLLARHDDRTTPLFPDLDYMIVSGEPLHPSEAIECVDRLSANIYSYYASSEGGGISLLPPDEIREYGYTVGRPMPDTDVVVVDAGDQPVPTGVVGRLRYRGPGVAVRYIGGDGKEYDTGEEGWFYPGDLAKRLRSGHIVLCGRDKDVIIRGGVNIYPAEIESVLVEHAAVHEAAVIGRTDPERGEIVVAFVATSTVIDPSDLETYCKDRLAPYKVPQVFRIRESLPKRASGKIDKQALRD